MFRDGPDHLTRAIATVPDRMGRQNHNPRSASQETCHRSGSICFGRGWPEKPDIARCTELSFFLGQPSPDAFLSAPGPRSACPLKPVDAEQDATQVRMISVRGRMWRLVALAGYEGIPFCLMAQDAHTPEFPDSSLAWRVAGPHDARLVPFGHRHALQTMAPA